MNRNRLAGISEALEENGNAKARPRAHSAHPQATQLTPKKNGTLELNYQQIEKMEAEGKDLLAMIMGGDSSSPPQKKAKTEISPVPVPSPPGRVPSTSTGWQQHPGSRGAMPQPGHGHVPIQHGRPGTGPTPHMNGKYPPDVKFAHGIGKISPNGFSPPPGTSWPGPAPTGLSFKHKQAQFCNPNIAGNNLLAAANAQAQQFRAQHDDRRQQYHQQHNHHEQKVFNRFGHHDHGGPPTPMPGAFGGHHIRGHGPPPRPHWQRPHGGHASRLDGRLHYSATRPGPRQPFHHGRTPNHRSPPRQGGPPRHRSPSRGRQSQPRSLVPLFDIDVKPEPPILLTVDDTPQGCGHDVLQNGEQNAASNHTKSVKPELLSEFDEPQASNEVDTQQQQASDGKRREGQPYRIPKKKRAPEKPPAPMLPDVQYFEPDERAASPGLEFYQPDEQSLEQRDEQFFEADEPTPSTSSAVPAVVPSRAKAKPQRRGRSASREPASRLMKRSQRDAVKEMARNRGRQMKSLASVALPRRSATQPRPAMLSTSRPRTLQERDVLTPTPNESPLCEPRTGPSAEKNTEEDREPIVADPILCDRDMEEVESENWRPSLIRRMDARKELLKLALGNDGDEADFQTHVVPPQEDSRRARAKLFKRRNVLFEKFLDTCDRKLKKLEKHGRLPKPVPRASTEERSKKTTRSVRASRRAVQPVTRKRGDKGEFKKPKLPTPKNRAAQKLSKRARATRVDPSDYRAVAAAALERLKKRLATKAPRKAPRKPKAAIVPSEAASLKEEVCRNSIVEVVGAGEDPAARPNEACFIKEEVECTEFEAVDDEPVGSEPVLSRAADIEPIFTKEGLCVHCQSHGMAKRLPHTADDCPYLQCHCTQCIAAVCLYEEEKALETVAVSDRFSTIFTLADLKN